MLHNGPIHAVSNTRLILVPVPMQRALPRIHDLETFSSIVHPDLDSLDLRNSSRQVLNPLQTSRFSLPRCGPVFLDDYCLLGVLVVFAVVDQSLPHFIMGGARSYASLRKRRGLGAPVMLASELPLIVQSSRSVHMRLACCLSLQC